jgi:hypothetical protein
LLGFGILFVVLHLMANLIWERQSITISYEVL